MSQLERTGDTEILSALEETVGILSKKWTVSILYTLLKEDAIGFSDLETELSAVSGKVLSECLESLQAENIIERRVIQEEPLRVEYALTDRGMALAPVIEEMQEWAETNLIEEDARVLIVDDDERLVQMHADWFDEYEIITSTDGRTAREKLDDDIDILVTDRRISDIAGEDLARYVRGADWSTRIVFLSSMRVDNSLLDIPFDAYIQKPTTPTELRETIRELLEQKTEPPTRRRLHSLQTRKELFESALGKTSLEDEAFRNLCESVETLKEDIMEAG